MIVVNPPPPPAEVRIVINTEQRQLTVQRGNEVLKRFPVAVGRKGWETPAGTHKVQLMVKDPPFRATWGVVPPGPDNPLGSRFITFKHHCNGARGYWNGVWKEVPGCVSWGIHGTPNRGSVGTAASHGCVRMYNEHVEVVYEYVKVGTPIIVR